MAHLKRECFKPQRVGLRTLPKSGSPLHTVTVLMVAASLTSLALGPGLRVGSAGWLVAVLVTREGSGYAASYIT